MKSYHRWYAWVGSANTWTPEATRSSWDRFFWRDSPSYPARVQLVSKPQLKIPHLLTTDERNEKSGSLPQSDFRNNLIISGFNDGHGRFPHPRVTTTDMTKAEPPWALELKWFKKRRYDSKDYWKRKWQQDDVSVQVDVQKLSLCRSHEKREGVQMPIKFEWIWRTWARLRKTMYSSEKLTSFEVETNDNDDLMVQDTSNSPGMES